MSKIAEFFGTDKALERAASGYTPNTNPPIGSVGPGLQAGQQYLGGGPILGTDDFHPASAWHGWPDTWDGTPMEGLGGVEFPTVGDWSGFGYGRQAPGGYANRVSIVGTCVDLNTRQLASFPVYGVKGHRPVRLPSWSENPEPGLYAHWGDFMKQLANSLQLAGEALVYATDRFADGSVARMAVLNPGRVTIEIDDGRVEYFLDDDPLPYADVCHIRYQTVPGRLRGISPINWVGRNLVSAAALEAYATDISTHGLWAILKNPQNLNAQQRDDAKRNFMAARAAGPSAPAVMSGGWEFETLSLSPKDMALVDLKVFDEQRIASAFGVPPYLVGLPQPGGMTYANVSSIFDYHWRATLRPMSQSIAAALSRWALPHGTRLEFNRDEYVRPALSDRVQAYSALHNIEDSDGRAAITVDEIRIAERFPPYEEIDLTDTEALTGSL